MSCRLLRLRAPILSRVRCSPAFAFAACCVFALLLPTTDTEAQSPIKEAAPMGTLAISASNTSYVEGLTVSSSVPFTFYVIAQVDFGEIRHPEQNFDNGIKGWEAQIHLPPELFVLQERLMPLSSLDFGDVPGEFIVGTGERVVATDYRALVEIQALLTTPATALLLGLGGTSPSSTDPPAPLFLEWLDINGCTNASGTPVSCIRRFARLWTLTLNPENPPLREVIEVSVPQVVADDSGARVHVPIEAVQKTLTAKRAGDVGDLAGFDLELHWDPAIADLVGVRLDSTLVDWFLQANLLTPGQLKLSAAASVGTAAALRQQRLVDLEFQPRVPQGQSVIVFDRAELWDSQPSPIPVVTRDGSLTIAPCDPYDPFDDGVTNAADVILTLQFVTGSRVPTAEEFCAADIDRSGDITAADAIHILRRAVGLEKAADAGSALARVGLFEDGRPGIIAVVLEDLAGADLVLRFDEGLRFLGTLSEESTWPGLSDVHLSDRGELRLATASAAATGGSLLLRFEAEHEGRVWLEAATAFGSDGSSLAHTAGTTEVALRADLPTRPLGARFDAVEPNPFNPSTQFRYHLAVDGELRFRIHDAAGRRVRELRIEGRAGDGVVRWDGLDGQGRAVASGVYRVQMLAGGATQTRSAVLLK